jgi:hypothetical protein
VSLITATDVPLPSRTLSLRVGRIRRLPRIQSGSVNAELGATLTRAAEASLKEFPRLTADNLALSVIDLTKPDAPVRADYHGDPPFYPASLVKLFFMVETYHQGKLTLEIERALREIIWVSDNDATAFLLDILTDTCSGSELEGKALHGIFNSSGRYS